MIKNLELRRQNQINDIKAFRTLIQKCFDVLDINENINYLNYTPSKSNKNKISNGELSQDDENNGIRVKKSRNTIEISSKERKDILNQVRNIAFDVVSGYCLVFKKQSLKKHEIKNPTENPSEKRLVNENSNEEGKKEKSQDENDGVEYKLNKSDDSNEMLIDEGNEQKHIITKTIEIINKNMPFQNIHENILLERHSILRCELSNDYNKEKNTNLREIPISKINEEKTSVCENQEKSSESEQKEQEIQINIDQSFFENDTDQIKNKSQIDDIERNSALATDSEDKIDQIPSNKEKKEINVSETIEIMKSDQFDNQNFQEIKTKYIDSDFKINDLENEFAKIPNIKNAENQVKNKDKKHVKEFSYKLQNNRNLIGKSPFINYNPLSYNDSLNPNLYPWFYIKCANMKPIEILKVYKRLIKDYEMYYKNILGLPYNLNVLSNQETNNLNKKGKKKKLGSRSINNAINTQTTALSLNHNIISNLDNQLTSNNFISLEANANETLYCYCKKPTSNDLMIGKINYYFVLQKNLFF